MLVPLSSTSEYVVKCCQCLRRSSRVAGSYSGGSSTTCSKNFTESHLRLLCHPAVMTDMVKGKLLYIMVMKNLVVINYCSHVVGRVVLLVLLNIQHTVS